MGLSMGAFASPNRAGVMNSLPAADRGAGGAMNQTFQNSAQVLSIGIFFTLMIVGLAASLPASLTAGLVAHGVPPATAAHVAHLPPVSVLFAAFLGYDPVRTLIGPHVLTHLSAANAAALEHRGFFPNLIAGPFQSRPAQGVRVRDRRLPAGRDHVVVARQPRRRPPHRTRAGGDTRSRHRLGGTHARSVVRPVRLLASPASRPCSSTRSTGRARRSPRAGSSSTTRRSRT